MRQSILLLLFVFCIVRGESQTKIFLKYNPQSPNEKYTFINPRDTAFLRLTYSVDMGSRYGFRYETKLNNPTGYYEIFVNDKIAESFFIKDGALDSTHTQYYDRGRTLTTYNKGVKQGPLRQYSQDNKLVGTGEYRSDELYLYIVYYETGEVARRSFSLPKLAAVRGEVYDKNGAVLEINNYSDGQPLVRSEEKYKNGVLDGQQKLIYRDYSFEMTYEMNRLVRWTLFDKKKKVIDGN